MRTAITLPGVECVGAADLYDGRHTLAREITGNPNLPATRRYKELLDRKDIDCIVAAVPDHLAQRVVVDACNAGKDIYCEKPMSHTAGRRLRDGRSRAEEQSHRADRLAARQFACSAPRPASCTRWAPSATSKWSSSPWAATIPPAPGNIRRRSISRRRISTGTPGSNDAPKIPFNPIRFARWRCWKEYGTGVGGDLMVHLISGMLFTLGWNEAPRSAQALGGIFRWKDGRNMPDIHAVLFDYHGVPVYVRLGLGAETPELARFMGPERHSRATGSELRHSPQRGIDTAPSYYSGGFPAKCAPNTSRSGTPSMHVTPGQEPRGRHGLSGATIGTTCGPHLWNFFQAVKTRKPVAEDAVFGNHAAIACHMANESYFRKKPVYWDEPRVGYA